MNYLYIVIFSITFSTISKAQVIENKNFVIEGFIDGCKKHKDSGLVLERFGKIKGSAIIDSYCKCRANFITSNLTFRQLEQIYYGKEKIDNILFQRMEYECTRQLDFQSK